MALIKQLEVKYNEEIENKKNYYQKLITERDNEIEELVKNGYIYLYYF